MSLVRGYPRVIEFPTCIKLAASLYISKNFVLSRNALGVEKYSVIVGLAAVDNLCSKVCPRAQIAKWGF